MLYVTRSPDSNTDDVNSIELLSILTLVLGTVTTNAGSIVIVGNVVYPSPGFTTFTPITLSRLIIGSS